MPKHDPRRSQPDFLRFRPLHAFTTTPASKGTDTRKVLMKVLWIFLVIALMFGLALMFIHGR